MSPPRAAFASRTAYLLAVALSLASCAPETAERTPAPTAPSLARGGAELPFHGILEARETWEFTPAPPPNDVIRYVDLRGTGTATHLGRYTLVYDATVTVATGVGYGSMTYTAANGDVLTATYTALGTSTNGVDATIIEAATITGGTGRFAGAAGSFVQTRTASLVTGVGSGSFAGTITLVH